MLTHHIEGLQKQPKPCQNLPDQQLTSFKPNIPDELNLMNFYLKVGQTQFLIIKVHKLELKTCILWHESSTLFFFSSGITNWIQVLILSVALVHSL